MSSPLLTAWDTTRTNKYAITLVFASLFLFLLAMYSTPSVFERARIATFSPTRHDQVTSHPQQTFTVQIVLVSGWRSGSSFSYELIASHPSVFALFEPLAGYSQLYLKKLRHWSSIADSYDYIRSLLQCNFSEPQLVANVKHRDFTLGRCSVIQNCQKRKKTERNSCDGEYLTSLCQKFPVTLLKFVRLPLSLTAELLADPALPNVHVVYIPRDPRAVMASRWNRKKSGWCNDVECNSAEVSCKDINDDLAATDRLKEKYPGRIHLFRYEDIALDPANKARELFKALGIQYHEKVDEFIHSHTTKQSTRKEDTFRVSSERVIAWVREMEWTKIETVQGYCKAVMEKLGYLLTNAPLNSQLQDVMRLNISNCITNLTYSY